MPRKHSERPGLIKNFIGPDLPGNDGRQPENDGRQPENDGR
jgi:hypothetical protein